MTFVGKSDIPVDSSSGNVGDNLFCVRYTDDFPLLVDRRSPTCFKNSVLSNLPMLNVNSVRW